LDYATIHIGMKGDYVYAKHAKKL